MASFGEKIRRLRRDRDVTQKDLADYLGVKSAAIGKYESEKDSYPNVKNLIKIAEYFKVSFDYLLKDEQPLQSGISANNSYIQSNVQADNGGVVVNGNNFSGELSELVRVYNFLNGKKRNELLNFAYRLEEKASDV